MFEKSFRKIIFKDITVIKFKNFQRKSKNTMQYAPMWGKEYLSNIVNQ